MPRPEALAPVYHMWANHQAKLLDTLRPLSPEQMQLHVEGAWAIWQLASNMAGGRLYWVCRMLGEDDLGHGSLFPGTGWEDTPDHPRTAEELIDAFEKTWQVVEHALDRWTVDDLAVDVHAVDFWGHPRTLKRAGVVAHMMLHEAHHSGEISLILRAHNLPTQINW